MGKSNAFFEGGPLDGKDDIVIERKGLLNKAPREIFCKHTSIAGKRIVHYRYELVSDLGYAVKYEYRGQVDASY